MQRVVEDLISLSRIEAQKFTALTDAIDLRPLIEQAAENARLMAAERNSTIVRLIEPRLPPIAADSGQILQLLDNLIANARRYTDAPGHVRVELSRAADGARLIVEDTAPGVPQAALPRLFERLYRVEESRSRAAGGAGLGLAICQAIVEAHQGRIEAAPSRLGGLRITIDLPGGGE